MILGIRAMASLKLSKNYRRLEKRWVVRQNNLVTYSTII
jgi:hypothetical protein